MIDHRVIRSFLIFLAALMCVSAIACTRNNSAQVDTTTAAFSDSSLAETTQQSYLESLPDADYGNRAFNILVRTHKKWEMHAPDINGQTVNDAVHARNIAVSDKYNVILNIIDVAGTWNSRDNFKKTVSASVLADDGMYDLVASCMFYMADLTTENYFANLLDIDTLNLSNNWWASGFVENNTVNNKLYYTVGEVCLTMWDGMFVIDFNKDMAEQLGLPDMYQLVKDKKWTLDKLFEFSANRYIDNNSGGTKDDGDTYGFVTNVNCLRPVIYTSGLRICKLNADNTATMTLGGEKYQNLYKKLYNNLLETDSCYYMADTEASLKLFSEERALFYTARNWNCEELRKLEINFGILPYPMYDEGQDNYISVTDGDCSMFSILSRVRDADMSGRILEALSAESAYSVIPQYYDSILKYRNVNDEESGEMLDLIRDTLFIDFGFVHSQSIGMPYLFLTNALSAKQGSISGVFKAENVKYQKQLDIMMQAYAKDS